MIRGAIKLTAMLESAASAISAVLLVSLMLIGTADVLMRYFFSSPFAWSQEFITLYLLPGLFFLAVSHTFAVNGHIGVDILQHYSPLSIRRVCQILIGVTGCLLFLLIAVLGAQRAAEDFAQGTQTVGRVPWPIWPSVTLVPLGAGLFALRLALHAAANTIALLGGEEVIPLPAAAGEPGAERIGE